MRPVHRFNIVASLPERLERLRELAFNVRWAWDHETISLFRRLDRELWEVTGHNPVALLGAISQERLVEALGDAGLLAHFDRTCQRLDEYIQSQSTWFCRACQTEGWCVAYFSMEFGVTECVPIYSGGLGVLAGDHMKSASDLGLPVVGIGLLYQEGYFQQYLNADGWQQEQYPRNDFYNMPIELVRGDGGAPVTVRVELPGRAVVAQLWRLRVGRVDVILLDTNVPENRADDQDITDELYGGDDAMRIQQEMILGIGGVRAISALGHRALVCHMNEGHSAFLTLERIRTVMREQHVDFATAAEAVRPGHLFTTHTPVPAGIDRFAPELVEKYLGEYRKELGLSRDELLALGREGTSSAAEPFCMAVLALKLSDRRNGVSKLHGTVSRRMWRGVWAGVPQDEVPIGTVTNGIHYRSWISAEMAELYDRYLGPRWSEDPTDQVVWKEVEQIPAEELWRTHERRRERLVAYARRRLRQQLERRGAPPAEIDAADEALDPAALTIGFARRFATYKRAALLLQDTRRLESLLNAPDRPVQILFAGKAHPKDNEGKQLIRDLVHASRSTELRRRIVFLEDYDMSVTRYLVQGCDIWLSTPRRLMEASGTSGMKAAANGALNMSVLDGWWDEAYRTGMGWAIGRGEIYDDFAYQDRVEANAIYDLLEKDAVPLFYQRGRDGLPRAWILRMKAAMRELCPVFNSNRMVHEYATSYYLPAADRSAHFAADGLAAARALAAWKANVLRAWPKVKIVKTEVDSPPQPAVGHLVKLRAAVQLGGLGPDDVAVELYAGPVDSRGDLDGGAPVAMAWTGDLPDGAREFAGEVRCTRSGQCGVTVRVRPTHADLSGPFELRLVTWAQ